MRDITRTVGLLVFSLCSLVAPNASARVWDVVANGGAACDGSANDLASIQAVINAAQAGDTIYFPPSRVCTVAGTLTVNQQLKLQGAGTFQSYLRESSSGAIAISVNTTSTVEVRDLVIEGPANSTAACIQIDAPVNSNVQSLFDRIQINQCEVGIRFLRASLWAITNSHFTGNRIGVEISNSNNADEGDSSITGSYFLGRDLPAESYGVLWYSSGGLRVVNNKFNVCTTCLVYVPPDGTVPTGLTVVTGNSFENWANQGLLITPIGTGSFRHFTITANQFFTSWAAPNAAAISVNSDSGQPRAGDGVISANVINIGTQTSGYNYGILIQTAENITVTGNTILGSTTTVGIGIGATAGSNIVVSQNGYTNTGYKFYSGSSSVRITESVPVQLPYLGTMADGSSVFCENCKSVQDAGGPAVGSACVTGGAGALARRRNGAWYCY